MGGYPCRKMRITSESLQAFGEGSQRVAGKNVIYELTCALLLVFIMRSKYRKAVRLTACVARAENLLRLTACIVGSLRRCPALSWKIKWLTSGVVGHGTTVRSEITGLCVSCERLVNIMIMGGFLSVGTVYQQIEIFGTHKMIHCSTLLASLNLS